MDRTMQLELAALKRQVASLSALIGQGHARDDRLSPMSDVAPQVLAVLDEPLTYGGQASARLGRPTGGSGVTAVPVQTPITVHGVIDGGTIAAGKPVEIVRHNGKFIAIAGFPQAEGGGGTASVPGPEVWRGKLNASWSWAIGGTVSMSVYDQGGIDTGKDINLTPDDHAGYYYKGQWIIAVEDQRIGKISGASNTDPIMVTTPTEHLLSDGDEVEVIGVGGNTAANGTWTVNETGALTFEIPVAGNNEYTSGGYFKVTSGTKVYRPLHPGNAIHGDFFGNTILYPGDTGTFRIRRWSGANWYNTSDSGEGTQFDTVTARVGGNYPVIPSANSLRMQCRAFWEPMDSGKQWIAYPTERWLLWCKFGAPVAVKAESAGAMYVYDGNDFLAIGQSPTISCPFGAAANKMCAVDYDGAGEIWTAVQTEC